ncbi:hypothetical protein F2Q70_00011963 [Brassica cretica]|uniref:Uncharacterized protein n=1 Tax=Brassica cretica TaxID=69181 RepID=A0A8S9LZ65_BRACR|nr:hypothetical protein F2Q70_00011963 [Brassica cretica]
MMKALKDISKSHKKSTSTRAPVAEPSLFISEKLKTIVELTVLQPEHPSSLVLSQQVFEEESLDYPHQGPRLDTRNPLDEDLGPIFDEEDEPGPIFDEEATSITSIVMESHLCFDPGTTPAPLTPDLQEHLITDDLFASSLAFDGFFIKQLLENKSLRTENDFYDLDFGYSVLQPDLVYSETDKTWHLLRSFCDDCVVLSLDDIVVYNTFFEKHLESLTVVSQCELTLSCSDMHVLKINNIIAYVDKILDRWASKKKEVSAEIRLQEVTANIDLLTELKDEGLTMDAELARLKGMEGDCEDLVASAAVPD